ncbi:hypothetical protein [Microbacterium halophytorum]|uniref:hypothetical protein n=1 Tax=Microbacterium halophytorum TaxID=2067568 RepID=UPI000CFB3FB8|nr:hypothetical protein [Microbacterium halophytorum]
MKLGTRWAAGAEPPSSVPEALRAEIARIDQTLAQQGAAPSWTLTWLEGRPIAELATGIEVTLDASGTAVTSTFDPMA